jgi:hypothetical protein
MEGKAMADLRDLITDALRDYRCTHTRIGNANGVDDDPLPLVDQLTPPGQQTIALGQQELELLADHIADALHDAGVAPAEAPSRRPLPQIELDALLDHIYENGTVAEGVMELARALCEAYARGVAIPQTTKEDDRA